MIFEIIRLIGIYFSSGFAEYWFNYFIALAFVASVPCLFRHFVRS